MTESMTKSHFETKDMHEIERAIDRIKKSAIRTEVDGWFKKQWYRCLAVRLQRKYELEKKTSIKPNGGGLIGRE